MSQLQDLQNELKSLKSLLLNRTTQRSFTPGTLSTSTSAPGLNSPSTNGTTGGGTSEPLNAINLTGTGTETPPLVSSSGSPFLPSRPGIPAWQLAAREKAQQVTKGEEEAVQTV